MGRTASGKVPNQPILSLLPRHRTIMLRIIGGERQVDIATDLQMTQSRLSVIVNSPLFKTELEKMQTNLTALALQKHSDIAAKIQALQPDALKVLVDLMENKATSQRLKRDVAKDILGLDPSRQSKNDSVSDLAVFITNTFNIASKRREETIRGTEENGGHQVNGDVVVEIAAKEVGDDDDADGDVEKTEEMVSRDEFVAALDGEYVTAAQTEEAAEAEEEQKTKSQTEDAIVNLLEDLIKKT